MVYAYDASGQRVVQARVADANGVGTASAYVASGQVDDPNTAKLGAVSRKRTGSSLISVNNTATQHRISPDLPQAR